MKISTNTSSIEEIKSRITIVELAIRLGSQPTRNNFIYSIYKNEKTPSLKLYPQTNSYYDFSTGIGGDIFKFYMDYCKVDFITALKALQEIAGISVDNSRKVTSQPATLNQNKYVKKVELLQSEIYLFEERAGIYEYNMGLAKHEAERFACEALFNDRKEIQHTVYKSLENFCAGVDNETSNYLHGKSRGLNDETIRQFRLFTIKNVKQTTEFLHNNFTKDELIISGLFNKKGNFVFSLHKLIIPYLENNRITYLRGRCIHKEDNISKYIGLCNFSGNLSPKRFYNLDVLKKLTPLVELIICEGEFDCIIAEQEGLHSIAIPGVTNIPKDQIHLIKDYKLFLAFDNDAAGNQALQEFAKLLLTPVTVIKLKKHKDLTELINEK